MVHKSLEEWFDNLIYIGIVVGLMGFFCNYWGNEIFFRYSKAVLQEFVDETAISGQITANEYEGLYNRLQDIGRDFDIEISCYRYSEQKIAELLPTEHWRTEFASRNVIRPTVFIEYEPHVRQSDAATISLQKETNASVLAATENEYLPLSEEDTGFSVCAVRPSQEVYEGEYLITLCRVTDPSGVYYKEAAPIKAKATGQVMLELTLNDKLFQVPVDVVCYPRTERCDNNHFVVNTREVLDWKKKTGKVKCPYCGIIPMQISCKEPVIHVDTNESIHDGKIKILVTYLDGSISYVTSDSEEWQDDFDEEYCGTQNVTIRYRNVDTKLTVVSENPSCTKCGGECNDRCYTDYLNYPYCLKCLSQMYLFMGKVKEEKEFISEKDLLSMLDTQKAILLNRGDYIMIAYKQGKKETVLYREIKINGKTGKIE